MLRPAGCVGVHDLGGGEWGVAATECMGVRRRVRDFGIYSLMVLVPAKR